MTSDDVRNATKDIATNASEAAGRARETAGQMAAGAGDKARATAGRVADAAQDAYGSAKDTIADIGDLMPGSAGEALEVGRRAYERGSDRVGRQVARQPIEALLLAGAIGYLVGWAANRS